MFKLLGLLAVVGGGAFLLFRRHRRNASRAPPSGPSKKTASSGTSSLLPGKSPATSAKPASQVAPATAAAASAQPSATAVTIQSASAPAVPSKAAGATAGASAAASTTAPISNPRGQPSVGTSRAAAAAEDRVSQARQALYTITENELIVHELLLQGGPSSPAQQDAEDAAVSAAGSNPMEGIRQIAERAFWDALQEGLQAQPPQWERIAALIGDARDQLVELIPATSQQGLQLRADLRDKLDMEYISMRLAAGFDPQYLRQLFDYLVFVIMGLEAPARSRSTKQGYAQLTQAFAFAPPASASRDAAGKLVDVHMDVEHSTRVPVDLVAHEAWLPVDVQPVETTTPSSARSSASSASLARHQRSENVNPNQAGLAQTAAAKAQASGETTPRAGSGPDAQPSDSSSSGNGNGDWVPMRRASVATAEQDEGTVMVGGSPSQPQEPTAAGVQGSSDSSGSGHGSPRTGSDDDGILVGIPSPQGPMALGAASPPQPPEQHQQGRPSHAHSSDQADVASQQSLSGAHPQHDGPASTVPHPSATQVSESDASPSLEVGAPVEECVQVYVGEVEESDIVHVSLRPAEGAASQPSATGSSGSSQPAASGSSSRTTGASTFRFPDPAQPTQPSLSAGTPGSAPESPSSSMVQSATAQRSAPPAGPALQSADTAAMLVEASKFVFEKVGQLRKDMARARLEMLKGLLQGTAGGVDYERRRLANAIGELPAREALPNTQRWLASTAHLDPAPSPHLEEKAFIRGLLAEGLLQLLQAPEALSPQQCPETLLLDCRRIVALQNELQRLALVAAALLIAQQLLAVKQVSSTTSLPENRRFYVAVKERLSSLLAQPDVRMDVLIEAMAALLAERCSSAGSGPSGSSPSSTSVTLSGGPGGGSGDSELVARMLGRIFSTSDPVFQKVQRGIVGALRVLLQLHGPTHLEDCNARLRTIGAELLAQEVQAMADVMRRMISLTAEVSEPYYRAIAQGLRTQLLSPRPQAT